MLLHVQTSLHNKYVVVSVDVVEDWFNYVMKILKTIEGKWRRMNSKFSIHLTYLCIRAR
jgi:hypothetical protein